MAQKILGLEVGADWIRGVMIESAVRGFEHRASLSIPIRPRPPEGGEEIDPAFLRKEALRASLGSLLEELGERPDAVIASLPGSRTASTILTLPFADAKRIDATLGFEVEGLLPFDIEEVIYDYQILSRSAGKSRLLVGVARLEEVEDFVDTLAGASLDPRVVTLPGLGAFALLSRLMEEEAVPGDRTWALVDLGEERTLVAIARGAAQEKASPTLLFHRSLEVGMGVPPDGGTGFRLGDGSPESKALAAALLPAVRQLRQTFHAARGKEKEVVHEIRLTGSASGLPGIGPWLEKELGIPVVAQEALPGGEGLDPSHALALGLAVRGIGRGKGLLDLRKGDLAFHGDLGYLRGKLLRVSALAASILVLLSMNAWTRLSGVKTQEEALDRSLCEITERVLGSCESDFNVAISKLQGGGTTAAAIPSASAIQVFSVAVSQINNELGMEVREVDASLDRLRLTGVVDSFEAVEKVEAALRANACVSEVRQGRVQKNREDKIDLSLEAVYVCGTQGEG